MSFNVDCMGDVIGISEAVLQPKKQRRAICRDQLDFVRVGSPVLAA